MLKRYSKSLDYLLASLHAYSKGKLETAGKLYQKAAEEDDLGESVEDLDEMNEVALVKSKPTMAKVLKELSAKKKAKKPAKKAKAAEETPGEVDEEIVEDEEVLEPEESDFDGDGDDDDLESLLDDAAGEEASEEGLDEDNLGDEGIDGGELSEQFASSRTRVTRAMKNISALRRITASKK